jgi:hypothetical protein
MLQNYVCSQQSEKRRTKLNEAEKLKQIETGTFVKFVA